MKNKYIEQGPVTIIFSKYNGEMKSFWIDTEDLPIINEFEGTWQITHNRRGGHLYVRHAIRENGKNSHIKLHRLLTGAPKNMVVDHINHDTLDNRKTNLRIVTNRQNKHNLTKFTGVSWYKPYQKWRARVHWYGKEHSLGYHENREDAIKAVIKFREDHGVV